jgi:NhaP-type Na+/H+ or K+/H+ antiporter
MLEVLNGLLICLLGFFIGWISRVILRERQDPNSCQKQQNSAVPHTNCR